MKGAESVVPPPKVSEALQRVESIITTQFPDATFEVDRGRYRGMWDLYVYILDAEERSVAVRDLMGEYLADLWFDHKVRILLHTRDKSYLQMRENWAREHALRDASKKSQYKAGDDVSEE